MIEYKLMCNYMLISINKMLKTNQIQIKLP